MEVIQTIITSFISIITLFILTRLIGHQSMAQLSTFDYINSITIGSIAAELATSVFTDAKKPFAAMVVYALVTVLLAILTNKSIKMRRFFTGKPTLLYDKGNLYYRNLAKAKMDIGELLMLCRGSGYFDLTGIETIVLEANGKLSILPLADQRPLIGKDLHLTPSQNHLVSNVIIDGHIMYKNLEHIGHTKDWLLNKLKTQGINLSDIFLATCDTQDTLRIYKKIDDNIKFDVLE